jgi:hypothetical protein
MMHTSIKNEPSEDRCSCEEKFSIPFLDVSCSLENGRIKTDLFKKETDKKQYLLPSSCHPKQTTKAIPFSLALRIVRICYTPEDRERRFSELSKSLVARGYNHDIVETAIEKARKVPRERALKKVTKQKQTNRPVLATPFDPRLSAISSIIAKHWRTMSSQDSYINEVFPEPPLTAYRRPQNLRGHLIRAKVAQTQRENRIIKGISERRKECYNSVLQNTVVMSPTR